ncbi:killer cell lectin-like receptor subfamily B member 1B allele C [Engystomops pustulosus]|uniref:killer cell lectin-like receptor subfamily B member 1B allele C n=1 Tax=Engystomops pustulosus TaxID=76066 RepID=UPI003AFA029E
MDQVTYSQVKIKKSHGRPCKTQTTEEVPPTIVYADIRLNGSQCQLSGKDPAPEVQQETLPCCRYKTLSFILMLITVLLCCALGYTVFFPVKKPYDNPPIDNSGTNFNTSKNTQGCRPLCPDDWIQRGDDCYYYSDDKKKTSWEKSRDHCRTMGADLLVIKTQEEQEFIQRTLRRWVDNAYWTGLCGDGSAWRWVDGEQYNSSLIQIKSAPSSGHCVSMTKHGYYPVGCNVTHQWTCLKKSET